MLLLYMSRVQRTVVLELRTITYFLRFSDPKKSCLKYNDFIITSVIRKDLQLQRQSKNTEVHRVYSSAKNRDGERSSPGTAVHASGASK